MVGKAGKTMSNHRQHSANILQREIRKQFGSTGTSRFLRAMPGFKVEAAIPERFANLLAELDRAEAESREERHRPRDAPKDDGRSADNSNHHGRRLSSRHSG